MIDIYIDIPLKWEIAPDQYLFFNTDKLKNGAGNLPEKLKVDKWKRKHLKPLDDHFNLEKKQTMIDLLSIADKSKRRGYTRYLWAIK